MKNELFGHVLRILLSNSEGYEDRVESAYAWFIEW